MSSLFQWYDLGKAETAVLNEFILVKQAMLPDLIKMRTAQPDLLMWENLNDSSILDDLCKLSTHPGLNLERLENRLLFSPHLQTNADLIALKLFCETRDSYVNSSQLAPGTRDVPTTIDCTVEIMRDIKNCFPTDEQWAVDRTYQMIHGSIANLRQQELESSHWANRVQNKQPGRATEMATPTGITPYEARDSYYKTSGGRSQ